MARARNRAWTDYVPTFASAISNTAYSDSEEQFVTRAAKIAEPFGKLEEALAKRGNASGDANGKALHARRLVSRELADTAVVGKLFDTIAPRFAERPGGYTRILRLGSRRGDSAEVAQLELVGSE